MSLDARQVEQRPIAAIGDLVSWFRRHEPFKSVLNHVDPPKEERLMGKVCPPESRP